MCNQPNEPVVQIESVEVSNGRISLKVSVLMHVNMSNDDVWELFNKFCKQRYLYLSPETNSPIAVVDKSV